MSKVAEAVEEGRIGGTLWLYSNYHCNMACHYCLTESSPRAPRRLLGSERMLELAREAAQLGFTSVGVGGGEPFLLKEMPELLAQLAQVLPVIVLTNGTLFTPRLLERIRPLAALPVSFQVSLDSADPESNDRYRESGNFDVVVTAIRRLREIGIRVRLATTGGDQDQGARAELCALHRSLGIGEDDHVVRPVVRRGRALEIGLGIEGSVNSLPPELTITADGAFWSPFAPTVRRDRLDTDLLVSRATSPLSKPAEIMMSLVEGRPPGSDATLEIR
jgi:MoaA/NifB/PqqE/SkfB family radical SAM enzyme